MSEPTEQQISVPWPGKSAIPITLTIPPSTVEHSGFGLLLGPGAGGDEKTFLLTAVANEAAKQGHICARYRAKVPNLGHRVSLCIRVLEHLFHPTSGVHPVKGCFLGGHSMGTRVAGTIASVLAAKADSAPVKSPSKQTTTTKGKKTTSTTSTTTIPGISADFVSGLILFSYPLHTPDNTQALRDKILYDIPATTPTLFVSGLNDAMCKPALFAKVFKNMTAKPRTSVQVVQADHGLGFGSSKSAKDKKEALAAAIAEWTIDFIDEAIAASDSGETKDVKKNMVVSSMKAEVKMTAGEWTVVSNAAPIE